MGMGEASNALVSLATLAFVPKREPSPLPQEASCSALAGGMYGAAHCWAVLSGPKELLPGLGWTWVAFFPSHPVPQLPAVWKGRQEVPCWLSRGSREAPATPALFRWCCRQRSQLRSCSHRARSPRGDPARRRREEAGNSHRSNFCETFWVGRGSPQAARRCFSSRVWYRRLVTITLLGHKSDCSLPPALEWRLRPGGGAAPRPPREPPAAVWAAQPSGSSLRARARDTQPAHPRSARRPQGALLPRGRGAGISLG